VVPVTSYQSGFPYLMWGAVYTAGAMFSWVQSTLAVYASFALFEGHVKCSQRSITNWAVLEECGYELLQPALLVSVSCQVFQQYA